MDARIIDEIQEEEKMVKVQRPRGSASVSHSVLREINPELAKREGKEASEVIQKIIRKTQQIKEIEKLDLNHNNFA